MEIGFENINFSLLENSLKDQWPFWNIQEIVHQADYTEIMVQSDSLSNGDSAIAGIILRVKILNFEKIHFGQKYMKIL